MNYLGDDVQGSIDLDNGTVKGDFSKYVMSVIAAWFHEHKDLLRKMWAEKKTGQVPA